MNLSIPFNHLVKHSTKKHSLLKFILVLFVFISYFLFVSWKYGAEMGISITLLTWSFFVFCTPIADAGFLLDFPMRVITGIRMLHSEMIVWTFAFLLNLYFLFTNPHIYSSTLLLKLFYTIITHPFPYWIIVLLSALGTFMSVFFADELLDVMSHKDRKHYHKHVSKFYFVVFLFLIVGIVFLYNYLLSQLGINII